MPIASVRFSNFKALSDFSVSLQSMNVLVGPNNCGKSTILSAFRVLEIALRLARRRRATRVINHQGFQTDGHSLPVARVPIPLENVHSNYAEEDSRIDFHYTNKNTIHLFFPANGGAYVYWDTQGKPAVTPGAFKKAFPDDVRVIPVLGPVEQHETIVADETVRRAAGTPRASRHFRNYWRKNPEGFDRFRELVEETWPTMSIKPPEVVDFTEPKLTMFAAEDRMDRELYWAGLGFQVWCQLLTYISRYQDANLLIVDEPEVYLHPEVQRQLLGILRDAAPDILLATHSVEILGEADPSEILMVDKTKHSAKRLRDIGGVQQAIEYIGSVQNLTLTELARNRRLLFVEGASDYKLIRRFARILKYDKLAAGRGLTVTPSGGFGSWAKIKGLAWGLGETLTSDVSIAAVFDRDFRSDAEIESLQIEMGEDGIAAHFHRRKEIENYLLGRPPLVRALKLQMRRKHIDAPEDLGAILDQRLHAITNPMRADCGGQLVASYCEFHKRSGKAQGTLASEATAIFDEKWAELDTRLEIVSGKRVLKELRTWMQEEYRITLTDFQILDAYRAEDVPPDMARLVANLDEFRAQH
ncbi:MAG: AAA family ATPase [Gammaproteobacteria bacterium]|nr:AAA family ATPase [Gammaproteobacteria bacterium]